MERILYNVVICMVGLLVLVCLVAASRAAWSASIALLIGAVILAACIIVVWIRRQSLARAARERESAVPNSKVVLFTKALVETDTGVERRLGPGWILRVDDHVETAYQRRYETYPVSDGDHSIRIVEDKMSRWAVPRLAIALTNFEITIEAVRFSGPFVRSIPARECAVLVAEA